MYRIPGHAILSLLATILLINSSGCGPREQISSYKFRKDKNASVSDANSETEANARMMIGLIQREQDWWIFKVTGPESEVQKVEPQIDKFFASITNLDQEEPTWVAPEGWQRKAISRMAASAGGYANFQIAGSELFLKISRLPKQDLLENTQRWRGQIGLAAIPPGELESQWTKTKHADGQLRLFDQLGRASGGGMMGAPFAGGPPKVPSQPIQKKPAIQFEVPEGWVELENVPVVEAKLAKKDGGDQVAISLTRMSGKFNDWSSQVKSWAGDAKVALEAEQLKEQTTELQVAGVTAKKIELIPAEIDDKSQAIFGIMFEKDGSTWFVKMNGEPETVKQSAEALDQFLKSLTIE